jgi:carboxypeptidase family protein
MKKLITLTTCVLLCGAAFAQRSASEKNDPATAQRKLAASGKCAIKGTVRDERSHPVSDVRVFLYAADSSIIASGYTDAVGDFETNSVGKGTYNVKAVYPNSRAIMIPAAILKPGYTMVNIKTALPAADTVIPFSEFVPKPVEKGKHGKGGQATNSTTTTTTKVITTTTTTTKTAAPAAAPVAAPKK